jgi:hypothetical protein
MAKNYVNNEDLLQALIEYQQAIKDAEVAGLPKPKTPEYIGECIYKIATNLAKKPNFSGYSFIEDMVGDGVRNCLLYMHNFDANYAETMNNEIEPEISDLFEEVEKPTETTKLKRKPNPFAYFTQIIYYAFLGRIESESEETYLKYKSLYDSELYTNHEFESKKHVNLIKSILNENTQDIIVKFEDRQAKKQAKKLTDKKEKAMPLDRFME